MSETLSAIIARGDATRASPALFVGLAGDAPRTPPARIALDGIDRVEIGRGDRRRVERTRSTGANTLHLTLADARVSERHARLTRMGKAWIVEDLGSKNGTWLGRQALARAPLHDGAVLIAGHTALVFREAGGEAGDLDGAPPSGVPDLTTLSPLLAMQLGSLVAASAKSIPIEIHGESGTGKELVARAVHALSRRTGRFVAVNCGALPAHLIEAELFGNRRGAYTGAIEERAGLVRSSDAGTLFLDEIAELPLAAQAALLRVLEEREVRPIGGDAPVAVDLRVVSATHRDLDGAVAANRFRADLRARLLGVTLAIPPLRERREDLGLLVAALLDRHGAPPAVTFSADAVIALYAHAWPLNVRELDRALGAMLAVAGDRIELHHLPPALVGSAPPPAAAPLSELSEEDRTVRAELVAAIARHGGNLAAVARALGKDRTQIRRWMKRFGLDRDHG